jgi:pimeloyl-ACP methyl ester carboxylesterase
MACGIGCASGEPSRGDVLLLHGFPDWSEVYNPLMRALASQGYRSVACNQRGYSPGASPDDPAAYNYDKLRDDVFLMATAVGFKRFHLVGHDHGAALGWYSAASDLGKQRVLSYTAMSVPHNDAFANGLYGDSADVQQQIASQYFTMFPLTDSAYLHGGIFFMSLGMPAGFSTKKDFQRALWWYNGVYDAGVFAMPPVMRKRDILKKGEGLMPAGIAALRGIFGGTPDAGRPAKVATGNIDVPVMYVCGSQDPAILCNRPYALKTKDYCKGAYEYVEVDCSHWPLACMWQSETQKVIDAVIRHISS